MSKPWYRSRLHIWLPAFLLVVALGSGQTVTYAARLVHPTVMAVYGARPDEPPAGMRTSPGVGAGALPASTATPVAPSAPQPASAYPTVGKATASTASYSLAFSGSAVSFDMSGFEPDFDPIYKVTVSGRLRDQRPAGQALPTTMLVLSTYLEVFQPDTTPILPDLLHPDQVATNLAGFLSGKAALVNVGGHIVYRGSLLAEIFQNSTEHVIIDLDPVRNGPSVRIQGAVTLHKGGAENGILRALAPLTRAALAVPRGRIPTWQAIVNGMSVSKPAMMGTAAAPGQHAPGKPATTAPLSLAPSASAACNLLCQVRRSGPAVPFVLGLILLLLGIGITVRRMLRE